MWLHSKGLLASSSVSQLSSGEVVENFESGSFDSKWTINDSCLEIKNDTAKDTYSAGYSCNPNNALNGIWSPDLISNGVEISEFEIYFYETGDSFGALVFLVDDNNDSIVGVGTNNPQLYYYNGFVALQIDEGFGTDRWIRARIYNIDWGTGSFSVEFEDTSDGTTVTTDTGTMNNPRKVYGVALTNTNLDGTGIPNTISNVGNAHWWDDIKIVV